MGRLRAKSAFIEKIAEDTEGKDGDGEEVTSIS